MQTEQRVVGQIEWNLIDQGSGPAILFVHGFPLDWTMWRFQVKTFSKNHRVICPDLPGYGKSKFLVEKPSTSMEEMADQLSALLESLQVARVAFCRLSMGGYVGWQFWAKHRDRLSHLIACDTRSIADTPEVARGRRILAKGVQKHGSQRVARAMIPKLFSATTRNGNPDVVAQCERVIANCSPATISRGHLAMSKRQDVTGHLEMMGSVPTMVVVGEQDEISTESEMREIARNIPGARFLAIKNAGHMAPLERPAEFNQAVLGFLAETG